MQALKVLQLTMQNELILELLLSKERGYHCVAGIFVALIGLIVTVTVKSDNSKYAGLCVLLFGSYVSAPLTVAWLSGNTPGKHENAMNYWRRQYLAI